MLTQTHSHFDIRDALEQAGAEIKGKMISCPWHEDKTPSGSIYTSPDGRERFKCFSCDWAGDEYDIVAKHTGKDLKDVLPQEVTGLSMNKTHNTTKDTVKKHKPVETLKKAVDTYNQAVEKYTYNLDNSKVRRYMYTDASGEELTSILRIDYKADGKCTKTYRSVTPVDGGYALANLPPLRPLYNLKEVTDSCDVIIVEGEKCVEALRLLGFVATTSMNGAGNSHHTDWSPLAGKDVFIFPDHDENGTKYVSEVMKIIDPIAKSIKVLDSMHYGLPRKGDIADMIAKNWKDPDVKNIIVSLLMQSKAVGGLRDYADRMLQLLSESFTEVHTHFTKFDMMAFGPTGVPRNSINIICGPEGTGKTFFNLQLMMCWLEQCVSCAALFLESDEDFYFKRLLAMVSGDSNFMSITHMRDNPDLNCVIDECTPIVDAIMKKISIPNIDDDVNYQYVIDWVESKFKAGVQVVIIDPITMASGADSPWIEDKMLMRELQRLTRHYSKAVFIVTHPKGEQKEGKNPLRNIAGGSALTRFASSVLFLQYEEGEGEVENYSDIVTERWNRRLTIAKTRDGTGSGKEFALRFHNTNLMFQELGEIQ